MKCKFEETKECIESALLDKWKDNKKETARLALGVCHQCPVYRSGIDGKEGEYAKFIEAA